MQFRVQVGKDLFKVCGEIKWDVVDFRSAKIELHILGIGCLNQRLLFTILDKVPVVRAHILCCATLLVHLHRSSATGKGVVLWNVFLESDPVFVRDFLQTHLCDLVRFVSLEINNN